MKKMLLLAILLALPALAGNSSGQSKAVPVATAASHPLPKVDHIVVVVEENHSYKKIAGNPSAPYMNELLSQGANLVNHYATRHPSQPNYLDLFSGSNQGVTDDKPNHTFRSDNLAHQLAMRGLTFAGYSEGLPRAGYAGPYDLKTKYARKHNPWVDFANVPASANLPLARFPQDYDKLPTVSFVIPNMDHDMHDGTIKAADDWLKQRLGGYVKWAQTHNSLLILTWDEDDRSEKNQIPTVFVGPMVRKGDYKNRSDHFAVLRTIEDLYGLTPLGKAKKAGALPIWKSDIATRR
ncbi:alkaline phosphatase family protein [Cohnella sp. REN36]|uniref:alkaline phosphatase family protein n=1 Tax=Cohnella sp. REN36 TaxID=2887347 RepID=UPI001D14BE49|nr:alkaline phosphatase family protein [Cohnella sp. REN36]MCC3371501.1 alkaline phosphatase family protein [Cohnella sp. REN36]